MSQPPSSHPPQRSVFRRNTLGLSNNPSSPDGLVPIRPGAMMGGFDLASDSQNLPPRPPSPQGLAHLDSACSDGSGSIHFPQPASAFSVANSPALHTPSPRARRASMQASFLRRQRRPSLSGQCHVAVCLVYDAFIALNQDEAFITTQFLAELEAFLQETTHENAKNPDHEMELIFVKELTSALREASSELTLMELESAVLLSTTAAKQHHDTEHWTCDAVLHDIHMRIQEHTGSAHDTENEAKAVALSKDNSTGPVNFEIKKDSSFRIYAQPTQHSPPPFTSALDHSPEDVIQVTLDDVNHHNQDDELIGFSKQDSDGTHFSFQTEHSNSTFDRSSTLPHASSFTSGINNNAQQEHKSIAAIVEHEDENNTGENTLIDIDTNNTNNTNNTNDHDSEVAITAELAVLFKEMDIRKNGLVFTSVIAHTITSVLAQNTLTHDRHLFLVEIRERFECQNTLEVATDASGAPLGLVVGKRFSSSINFEVFCKIVRASAQATQIELESSKSLHQELDLLGVLQQMTSHAAVVAAQASACLEVLHDQQLQLHLQAQLQHLHKRKSLSSSKLFRRLNIFTSRRHQDDADIPKSPMTTENLKLGTRLLALDRKPSKTALRDNSKRVAQPQVFLARPDADEDQHHVLFQPSPVFVRKVRELN